jgi:hypothetical protein
MSGKYLPAQPPPLIPYRDASCSGPGLEIGHFQEFFDYYYRRVPWYTTISDIPVRIRFRPKSFFHAFFKGPYEDERDEWQPERACRIFWIGYTLDESSCVLQLSSSRFNVLCRMFDKEWPWFLVSIDQNESRFDADFVTAFPADQKYIGNLMNKYKTV